MSNGLMIIGKLAKIEYAKEVESWDNLIFECEAMDNRLGKSVPLVITALLPTTLKNELSEFQKYAGLDTQIIVPVRLMKSSKGNSFLMVSSVPVDLTELLTQG